MTPPAAGTMEIIGIWVAALCCLGIFSFLWRENKVYRFFEHVFAGVAGGYGLLMTWYDGLRPKWWEPLRGGVTGLAHGELTRAHWSAVAAGIAAVLVGSMWYFQAFPKYRWVSRVIIGLLLGTYAGLTFKGVFGTAMPQVTTSFKPVYVPGHVGESLSNVVFVVALACTMAYFLFAVRPTNRPVAGAARLGRLFLMVAFGAFFGNTVMARLALLAERMVFLMDDWVMRGIVGPLRGLLG